MKLPLYIFPAILLALLLLAVAVLGADSDSSHTRWVGSWGASQQLVEPHNSLSADDLRDATLRQLVHLSLGGNEIRLRISNRFGATPLHFTAVHVAQPVSPSADTIDAATDKALTFSGSPEVTIPPHADYISDPVSFPITPLSDLAITLHFDAAPAEQTGHPGSRATSYVAHGSQVSAAELADAKTVEHWYYIAGVDVLAAPDARAVVVLGDSITDGHGVTTNGNDRWTDVLAQRLQALPATRDLAVLNQGIGGNRLLDDGLGPNALARFDHDVIAQPEARYLIVLEGINDIGMLARTGEVPRAEHDALAQQIIGAYQQIIARAHSHDIKVIGATIMPFVGSSFYHPSSATEGDRQAVNEWIRASGHFDAAIDFDKVTRDPAHPDRLLPAFDSGDHLHPSPKGYAAMGEAVALPLFSSTTDTTLKMAITFDDLPAHGPLPAGETRVEVITKLIAALQDGKLPPTYGFMNGARVEEQPADIAVLQAWHAAGNPLGNHSWSHMNLNQHTLEDFENDVLRNEAPLVTLMKDEDWHWFRYPFLAEGEKPEKRAGARDFLRQRGYKVAAVTMSFGDYMWNDPYARCKAKGDRAAIETLEETYLGSASENIDHYRGMAHAVYGRDIPYVLLMHVGAFDAEMLPRLLQLYRDKGFEFVTLPEAERDDFYRSSTDLGLSDTDTLEGAMGARQKPLPSRTDFSKQLDSMCR